MTPQSHTPAEPFEAARRWLWIGLITAASLAFSRAFGCATPLVALATLAALNMRRGEAVALVLIVWALSQAVNFLLLHYPCTPNSYEWGVAIGVAGLLALSGAMAVIRRARGRAVGAGAGAFIVAFGLYEGALYATALILHQGGGKAFTPTIVARMAEINAAALAVLLVLNALALRARLIAPSTPRLALA